jgi:thymidylate synthase (FAD)
VIGQHGVLDHGYVAFIESWGSEEQIIEAARQSTDKGFLGWGPHEAVVDGVKVSAPGDEKLLRYLYENKHMTPFEMAGATFEVQAPIFVFREWHRHRTQSYNEMSARYTVLPDLYYVPSLERMRASRQSTVNKQGTGGEVTEPVGRACIAAIEASYRASRMTYEDLLRFGVGREVARLVIPVSQYSRMRVSTDLRNWMGFLELRCAKSAQWEIRQYANVVKAFLTTRFPRTLALFNEGVGRA